MTPIQIPRWKIAKYPLPVHLILEWEHHVIPWFPWFPFWQNNSHFLPQNHPKIKKGPQVPSKLAHVWFCCHEFTVQHLDNFNHYPTHTCSTSQNSLYHVPSRKELHRKALGVYHNSVSCWWSITLRMLEQFNQRLKRNVYHIYNN